MGLTTNKNDPRLGHGVDNEEVPQNEVYLILSEEERAKGFVRPVRRTYVHIGKNIDTSKMIALTEEQKERYSSENYIGFIPNEDNNSSITGRLIRKEDLMPGCNVSTTMAIDIAETYARNPKFYGSTYCIYCQKHLRVEEFVWYGTNETVGS